MNIKLLVVAVSFIFLVKTAEDVNFIKPSETSGNTLTHSTGNLKLNVVFEISKNPMNMHGPVQGFFPKPDIEKGPVLIKYIESTGLEKPWRIVDNSFGTNGQVYIPLSYEDLDRNLRPGRVRPERHTLGDPENYIILIDDYSNIEVLDPTSEWLASFDFNGKFYTNLHVSDNEFLMDYLYPEQ